MVVASFVPGYSQSFCIAPLIYRVLCPFGQWHSEWGGQGIFIEEQSVPSDSHPFSLHPFLPGLMRQAVLALSQDITVFIAFTLATLICCHMALCWLMERLPTPRATSHFSCCTVFPVHQNTRGEKKLAPLTGECHGKEGSPCPLSAALLLLLPLLLPRFIHVVVGCI